MSTASTPFCSVMITVSGPMSGASEGMAGIDVIELDGEQHHIHRTDGGGVVRGLHRNRDVALGAGDPQPLLLKRRQVRAARDERDIFARGGQSSAEIAANRAGAEYCDTHKGIREKGSGIRDQGSGTRN